MSKLKAASPSDILVIAGWNIEDIERAKKLWIHPDQKCIEVIFCVYDHTFNVRAMSRDKISFLVPSTFTIGISILFFIKLVSDNAYLPPALMFPHIIRGAVEDQIRVVAASMTMEEILKEIKRFQQLVFNLVQFQIDQFGIYIYKADIKQLQLDHSHFCSRCGMIGKQINQAHMLKGCNH